MKFLIALFFLLWLNTGFSQWQNNPDSSKPLLDSSQFYIPIGTVSDGAGGAIFIYYFVMDGAVYAQKTDVNGYFSWKGNNSSKQILKLGGKPIDSYSWFISDGNGGAFLLFQTEQRPGELILQHINTDGDSLWGALGKKYSFSDIGAYTLRSDQSMAADSSGGVYIGMNFDPFYVQHFDKAGEPTWPGLGVMAMGEQFFPMEGYICGDGRDGVIAAFLESRTGDYNNRDVIAQRINKDGTRIWGDTGKPVCTAINHQYLWDSRNIIADGTGGAIINFYDARATQSNLPETANGLSVQRIDSSGKQVWQKDGIVLYTYPNSTSFVQAVSDGNGGFAGVYGAMDEYVYEPEFAYNSIMVGHKITADGHRLWGDTGTVLLRVNGGTWPRSVISFDSEKRLYAVGGADGNTHKLYAQKYDKDGKVLWDTLTRVSGTFVYKYLSVVPSYNSGQIVVWHDPTALYDNSVSGYQASKIKSGGGLAFVDDEIYFSEKNGNWSDPATWQGGRVPTGTANAFVRNALTVDIDVQCNSLKVEKPGGSVHVNSGINMVVLH